MAEDHRREIVKRFVQLATNQTLVEQKVQELHDFLRKICEDLNREVATSVQGELLVVSDIRVTPSRAYPLLEWEVQLRGSEILGFTCQAGSEPFWHAMVASCQIREGRGRRVSATLYLLREGEDATWNAVEQSAGVTGMRRPVKIDEDFLLGLFLDHLDRIYGG
jgi:hypothetical protein